MALAITDACSPASHEEVARYVAYIAGAKLDRQAKLEREVEAYVSVPPGPMLPEGAVQAPPPRATKGSAGVPDAHPPTDGSATVLDARRPPPAGLKRAALLAAAFALAGVGVAAAFRARPAASVAAEPPPPPPTQSAPAAEDTIELEGDPPQLPAAEPAPKRTRSPRRPPPATTAAARAPCDPPYSIDDHGRKHYRPECLP
jgi:hypothetical protein